MDGDWLEDTRVSYDAVAESYAEQTRDALSGVPFLRAALRLFADSVHDRGGGVVADVGCGPGHVTAHLQTLGVDVVGIDLSPAMIDVARRDHPHLAFTVGSMTRLGVPDGALSGLLAFWSLIHIPDDEIPGVLGEFRRVLRPDAPLLVGFHLGDRSRLKTQGYGGHPMKVYVHRRPAERVAGWLREAGFVVTARMLVDLDTELPGALVFARRIGAHGSAN
ncbi:class I SAM-dependent methyltransferase [Actinospica sp.]|uniref:class I SAM-dependent methyltransferase n=1 Tax=Actinospica sp. TaxID=1872142 RepID=UPI002CBDCDAB|nr:class I SAM-dependent methyltransferase [Actinospica sp.]HWG28058.1 class I SAM-dependent methyltransferase [Actinospica sp.]